MINIKYFARLSESLGSKGESLPFDEHIDSVDAMIRLLAARGEPWTSEFTAEARVLAAVNHEICETSTGLKDGDEVAFFPPVTGG